MRAPGEAVGTFVHVSANGGYRSPSHALTRNASTHCWGTAVNIYRIGDTFLDDRASIERYAGVAREVADIGSAPGRRFMIRVAAHRRNLSEPRSNYIN